MCIRSLALAALAFAVLPSGAAAECTCRAKGVVAEQGKVVCLATPQGPRMARCEKVLNNSSWTFLERPCPVLSEAKPADHVPERLATAARRPRRR